MEDGLTESESGRKPSNSAKSTYKCALALDLPGTGLLEHYNRWDGEPLPLSEAAATFLRRTAIHHDRLRRSSRRRIGLVIGGLSCGLMVVTALAIFAFQQADEADQQRRATESALKAERIALGNAEASRKIALANEKRALKSEKLAKERLDRIEKGVGGAERKATLPQQAEAVDGFLRKFAPLTKMTADGEMLAFSERNPAIRKDVDDLSKSLLGANLKDEKAVRAMLKSSSVSSLIIMLKDSDRQVRLKAAQLVRIMGSDARVALPTLVELVKDPDALVRGAAIGAIGAMGHDAATALPVLQGRRT